MRNQIMLQTSDSQFAEIVSKSTNYADICRALTLRLQGSNYGTIKRRIARQKLSVTHFNKSYIGKVVLFNTIPLEKILIENSTYLNSKELKNRLIRNGFLQNKCYKCGLENIWKGEPITLQLDHINGNHRDNRIENLRVTCPNCHSQTPTHSGKRLKKKYFCPLCRAEYSGYGKICIFCSNKESHLNFHQPLVNWPDMSVLKILVWKKPMIELAEELNCSSNGLKRVCIKNGITLPPYGYWQRIKAGQTHEEAMNTIIVIRTPQRKWTKEEIFQAKNMRTNGLSYREIGNKFGIAHTTATRLCKMEH